MKKIILLLLLLIPFLSACTSVDADLSINSDKSASVVLNMLSDKDIDSSQIQLIKSDYKDFLDDKYEVSDSSTDDGINLHAEKRVKNLSDEDIDLSSLGFVSKLTSGRFVDVKHNFFITSYNINMIYNVKVQQDKIMNKPVASVEQPQALKPEYLQRYSGEDVPDDPNTDYDFAQNMDPDLTMHETAVNSVSNSDDNETAGESPLFDDDLKLKFSISLPAPASYNNAQSVNGNVYSWVISSNSPTEIKLQYVVYSGFAIFFLIFSGILFLVYIARRIHRHDSLKRIGNNN